MPTLLRVTVVVAFLALPGLAQAGEGLYPMLPTGVPEVIAVILLLAIGWLFAGRSITHTKAIAAIEVQRAEVNGEMARLGDRIKDTRSWVGSVSKRGEERESTLKEEIQEVRDESATQKDVAHLQDQLDELRSEMAEVRAEVAEVRAEVLEVRAEVSAVHADTSKILAILGDLNG